MLKFTFLLSKRRESLTKSTPPSPFVNLFLLLVKKRIGFGTMYGQENSLKCVLCNKEKETCDHLFTECIETWIVWTEWFNECGYVWISPNSTRSFFEVWNECDLGSVDLRILRMAYFVAVWTIWKERNEVIFKGKEWSAKKCVELVRFRLVTWANARWPREYLSVLDAYRKPLAHSSRIKQKSAERGVKWEEPKARELKFNMDPGQQV
ncbi:Uncharacterized protein TCM_032449 [Theobroma cacao]|uniref:Reverse transcriptase zinc-binding domain-containing protein n=1 Tax=Theobroma cacao TaxID=3641 RepID=A0A061FA81_THECC|nr:Uncharacterized protein TCM_032449 [Theobroma cacao]